MNDKTKKILDTLLTVVCAIIFVFATVIVISSISSQNRGYTAVFGTAYMTVASDSMSGSGEDNFKKDDLIAVKLLSDEEKELLEEGQIISFYDTNLNGDRFVNSHRILEKNTSSDGKTVFITKGDANSTQDSTPRTIEDVIGVFQSKSVGIGAAFVWLQSGMGMLICVVIPSLLLVAYCVFIVIRSARDYSKSKIELAKADFKDELTDALKEELRAQLLKEMQEQNSNGSSADAQSDDEEK